MALTIALNTTPCTTQTMLTSACDDNKPAYTTMYTTTYVNIRKKPTTKSKIIKTVKTNKKIKVIKPLKNGWSKIRYNGEDRYICSQYLSKKKTKYTYVDMPTPINNSFKSYMDYRCITNTSSIQYKFQQQCYSGRYGVRMKDDRYCIAVGSHYTTKIGTKIDLVMYNGSIVKCILADCKADAHTDATNRQNPNGSIVEFVVDTYNLDSKAKLHGDLSYADKRLKGQIKYIRVYK